MSGKKEIGATRKKSVKRNWLGRSRWQEKIRPFFKSGQGSM